MLALEPDVGAHRGFAAAVAVGAQLQVHLVERAALFARQRVVLGDQLVQPGPIRSQDRRRAWHAQVIALDGGRLERLLDSLARMVQAFGDLALAVLIQVIGRADLCVVFHRDHLLRLLGTRIVLPASRRRCGGPLFD